MSTPIIPTASAKVPQPGALAPQAYVGAGAVDVFRARCLASSLRLWSKTGIIPTRGVGIRRMIGMAFEYTGTRYPATKEGAGRAAVAVTAWADDAAATLDRVPD